jgi:hypothetical protein
VPFAAVRTLEKISESCETILDASQLTEVKRMNVQQGSCGSHGAYVAGSSTGGTLGFSGADDGRRASRCLISYVYTP